MDQTLPRRPPKRVFAAVHGEDAGDPTPETYADLEDAHKHFNATLFDGRLHTPCLITLRARTSMGYFYPDRFEHVDGRRSHEIALNPEEFAIHSPKDCLATLVRMMVHQRLAETGVRGRRGYHNRPFAELMRDLGLPTTNVNDASLATGEAVVHRIEPGGRFDVAADALLKRYEENDDAFRARWADRFLSQATFELARAEAQAERNAVRPAPAHMLGRTESRLALQEQAQADDGSPTEALKPPAPGAVVPVFEIEDVVIPARPEDPTKIKYQCPQCGWSVWGKAGMALVCGVDALVLQQMNLPPGHVQQPVKLHPAIKLRSPPDVAYWDRKKRR